MGSSEIVRSLGRASPGEVRRITARLWFKTELLFMYVRANKDLDKAALARVTETMVGDFEEHADDCLGAVGAAPTESALDEPANIAHRMRGASLAAQSAHNRCAVEGGIEVGRRLGQAALGRPAAFDEREDRRLGHAVFKGASYAADKAATMFDDLAAHRPAAAPVFRETDVLTFEISPELETHLRSLKTGDHAGSVIARAAREAAARAETAEKAADAVRDLWSSGSESAQTTEFGLATTAPTPGSTAPALVAATSHPLVHADLPLSALWELYSSYKVDQRQWKEDEKISSRGTLKLVLAIVGDKRAADYTPQDIRRVQQVVRKLPAKYAQRQPWRSIYETQGPIEVVEQSKNTTIQRVSDRTWNNHYSSISGCFAYATTPQGAALPHGSVNPCSGLFVTLKVKKQTRRQRNEVRRMFEAAECRLIFTSAKFLGAASASRWHTPGPLVVRDHRYWLVIIGFLHGNRREEPVLLRVKHVKRCPQTGIWYFDLEDPELLALLKDSGSARLIPLHRTLIELGFLEARVFGRDPEERLFPEAESTAEIARDAGPFGKWFLRLRRHLGITDPAADWHAARTTVINLLAEAGVGSSIIEALVGHEGQDRRTELETYRRPMRLEILKEAIDKLDMPIDVAALTAAVERSDASDRSAAWPDLKAPLRWQKKKLRGKGGDGAELV